LEVSSAKVDGFKDAKGMQFGFAVVPQDASGARVELPVEEDDASYIVLVTPCWPTRFSMSAWTATDFTVAIVDPPGSASGFFWALLRHPTVPAV
jgi:hypothetical protein